MVFASQQMALPAERPADRTKWRRGEVTEALFGEQFAATYVADDCSKETVRQLSLRQQQTGQGLSLQCRFGSIRQSVFGPSLHKTTTHQAQYAI